MKKFLIIASIVSLLTACGEIPETFKITYHGNGNTSGFPPVDNNQYKSGEYATVLDKYTLQKDGHKFAGWNTSQDNSGTHYDSGSRIEIKNRNIFLHAVWSK